jgi:general secretion pathway protein M
VTRPLPRWASRGLALGLLLLIVALLAATTVVPAWQLSADYDRRIAEVVRQLQRFTDAAGQQQRLESDRNRLQASGASGRYYLAGSTAALAAAELQRVVKRIVTANKGQVASTQVVPTDDGGDVQRVVIRVQMRGDIDMVQRAFHGLETGRPYLFLDNVRLRPWRLGVRRRGVQGPQQLNVQFDLMGYLLVRDQAAGAT